LRQNRVPAGQLSPGSVGLKMLLFPHRAFFAGMEYPGLKKMTYRLLVRSFSLPAEPLITFSFQM